MLSIHLRKLNSPQAKSSLEVLVPTMLNGLSYAIQCYNIREHRQRTLQTTHLRTFWNLTYLSGMSFPCTKSTSVNFFIIRKLFKWQSSKSPTPKQIREWTQAILYSYHALASLKIKKHALKTTYLKVFQGSNNSVVSWEVINIAALQNDWEINLGTKVITYTWRNAENMNQELMEINK